MGSESNPVALVEKLEQLTSDQPVNPLRPNQVEYYKDELERCESIANSPPYIKADRAAAATRCRQLRQTIATQAPHLIENAYTKTEVSRLTKEVMEKIIRPTLLPRSVMRRNPQGAVSHFLRGENSRFIKRAILAWKRARFALDPHTDNPDHANVELYRPQGYREDGAATFMPDAQIPGNFSMTPAAKENWPLGDPTIKTAVSHLNVDTSVGSSSSNADVDANLTDADIEELRREVDGIGTVPTSEPAPKPVSSFHQKGGVPIPGAPSILCECGCGREFVPKATNQKFATTTCRNRAYKRTSMRGQGVPRPKELDAPPDESSDEPEHESEHEIV